MVEYLHIYSDEAGQSHLAAGAWLMQNGDFTPPSPPGYLISDTMDTGGCLIMHHPKGYRDAWHTAPSRVLVISLVGCARITTSDGNEHIIQPGDPVLVEDTEGYGHKMEGVDGQAYTLALILLEGESES